VQVQFQHSKTCRLLQLNETAHTGCLAAVRLALLLQAALPAAPTAAAAAAAAESYVR
jgi:hypothetical protein